MIIANIFYDYLCLTVLITFNYYVQYVLIGLIVIIINNKAIGCTIKYRIVYCIGTLYNINSTTQIKAIL